MRLRINTKRTWLTLPLLALSLAGHADGKLTGTVIGSPLSVDYSNTSHPTTTVNTCAMAFDGRLDTYFASWERSYTWAGLDLGSEHVITRVGWSPRNDGLGEGRVVLGVFEGANREDFMDALPIYVITERGKIGQISYADVSCSRGFRYVRYVGPADARCNIAELEFYGHAGSGDDSHLYQVTNLPTVSIHTLDGEIPYDKEHQIVSQLTIISDNGTKVLSEPGTTRERGNASRNFPKKPYRIKFDKKQRVIDAPAKAKKWTLINNYGDKTLMRNLLAFHLSELMGMPYTPYGTAVDVLLNGEYKGCYQLCDQVEVREGRVDVTEMTPEDNSGDALTGGYLIEVDAYADQETSWFRSNYNTRVTIKSPDDDAITTQQKNYIKSFYNKVESQWRTYLDLDTYLRHFLVGEMSGNTDTYWSVYMYKRRGEDRMYTGPVWDFDLAFENDNRTYRINNHSQWVYQYGSVEGYMRTLTNNIIADNSAKAKLLDIWDEARHNGLDEEQMTAFIDQLAEDLDQSQQLNFTRWPIMNSYVHQNPAVWGSYEGEVNNVKRYVKERIEWMDKKLNYVFVPREPTGIQPPRVNLDRPYQVYTLSGQSVGSSLNGLPSGIYIVRQGQASKKIAVP